LGGKITNSVTDPFTHLVTPVLKGSIKLFSAFAKGGVWIVQPNFIYDSVIENRWVSEKSREWCEEYIPDIKVDAYFLIASKRRREMKKAFENWKVVYLSNSKEILNLFQIGGSTILNHSSEEELSLVTHLYHEGSSASLEKIIDKCRSLNPNLTVLKKTDVLDFLSLKSK
jgi:hypothetical protein